MVLEDDDIFMELNQRILQKSGYASGMLCYDNAQRALDDLADRSTSGKQMPDFILLDLRMPIINGFEFLDRMNRLTQESIRDVKVCMLTSSLDENDITRAFSYGHVFGFLSKPLSIKKLEQLVSAPGPIRPIGI